MDKELARLIDADTPKLNPDIANGLAVKHLQSAEAYIDSVWRAVEKGFPEGFEYVRGERCTPEEGFAELTRVKNNKRQIDVARSDIYMVKYLFRYKGEEIRRYLSLPFVGEAGEIYLGGSRFLVSPVLADRVISVGENDVFIRLNRAMVTFERLSAHYKADGQRETVQVLWSLIYNKDPKKLDVKPAISAKTTIAHYLLCKFGFTEMFQRYGHTTPVLGTHETISPAEYPPEEWVICSSSQFRPRTFAKGQKLYVPSQIRLAIRRSEYTQMVKNLVAGFFYVVDHFPEQVKIEWVDRKDLWLSLLGELLLSSNVSRGRLVDDMRDHIQSLDEYIDEVMKIKFREIDMPIEDMYQLFGIMLERFNDMVLTAGDKINSMYDKELSINYYVLNEITKAINKFYFKLKSASRKELTARDIIAIMNVTIKPGLIFHITKKHGEVSTVSAPGDNKAFKLTSILVPQASSNKANGRNDSAALKDPAKRLHVSVAEHGSYSNLPKSAPDGRSRINLNTLTDGKGNVLRNPEDLELTTNTQEMLKRR